MPELPEVELIVRSLNSSVAGSAVAGTEVFWSGYLVGADSGELRKMLSGQRFGRTERHGKFILIRLDSIALLIHLRMTGKILRLPPGTTPPPHTHVIMHLDDGYRLSFSDTRKFGRLEVVPAGSVNDRIASLGLGIEPFGNGFTARNLAKRFAGRRRSVKNTLLDQSIIVGIGNIYACEILFTVGIAPFRPAASLTGRELVRLVRATRRVLGEAIDNGGSSISDYVHIDGGSGEMQNRFKVYSRAGKRCVRCRGTVVREIFAGRGTFWCPSCQH